MQRADGMDLPELRTAQVPGPRSRALAQRLGRVECPGLTWLDPLGRFPVFWERASGANVWDVDGNRYVDLTAAFGVATLGHAHPAVTAAVARQTANLLHGMGDVHPPAIKVELLERLAALCPGRLGVTLLGLNGADATEAALKAAWFRTRRPGIVAFEGGYHGLLGWSLETVGHPRFRVPFEPALRARHPEAGPGEDGPTRRSAVDGRVTWLPYPDPLRPPDDFDGGDLVAHVLARVDERLAATDPCPVGAVLVEPIQGRGGVVVPPRGFLRGLRELCDRHGAVLIFDEIFTGLGRCGERFACDAEGVVPDVLLVGKALGGGMPISACVATPEVMEAWPRSEGEAVHTSTFLGHPVAAAAALAALDVFETGRLALRSARAGSRLRERLRRALAGVGAVAEVRGRGLMVGVDLVHPDTREPWPEAAAGAMLGALRRGVLVLPSGRHGNVVSITPPLTIAEPVLDDAVERLAEAIREAVR